MGFVGFIPRFLKAHAGLVLTALGSAGLIGTVVLAIKESPDAQLELEEEQCQKLACVHDEYRQAEGLSLYESYILPDEWYDKASLTKWEQFKILFPIYLPAILLGTGTLACFWGAQIFNARKQAALIAAYGTLVMQFDQYRQAIRAEYGEEADKKAYLISQQEVKKLQQEIELQKKENGPYLYTFASLPGVIFEAKPGQVFNALMHYNHNAMNFTEVDLAMLYRFVGLPDGSYDISEAEQYGWQGFENECSFGDSYIDFEMEEVTNRDGRTVYVINPYIPPYDVSVDYQEPGTDSGSNLYAKYDPDAAKALARQSSSKDVYKVDKNHVCYAVHQF